MVIYEMNKYLIIAQPNLPTSWLALLLLLEAPPLVNTYCLLIGRAKEPPDWFNSE